MYFILKMLLSTYQDRNPNLLSALAGKTAPSTAATSEACNSMWFFANSTLMSYFQVAKQMFSSLLRC